ncbi:LysR family transcriptional regulator [Pseudoalteromonas sp. B28]
MRLPLTAIYYFDSVARNLSYTRAAKELCITHSAVIAQVKKLEDWLEVALVKRKNNTLVLTEKGLWLASSLDKSMVNIRNSISTVRQNNTITIKTIPSLASDFLLPHLSDLKSAFPAINFNINYVGYEETFVDLVLDFCDRGLEEGEELLFYGKTIPVCGEGYKKLIGEFNIKKANKYEYLHDSDSQAWRKWFNIYTEQSHDLAYSDKGSIFGDFNLMRTAAINNSGIALCPKSLIKNDLKSNKLIQLSDKCGNLERKYFIKAVNPDNPRIDKVKEFLIKLALTNEYAYKNN